MISLSRRPGFLMLSLLWNLWLWMKPDQKKLNHAFKTFVWKRKASLIFQKHFEIMLIYSENLAMQTLSAQLSYQVKYSNLPTPIHSKSRPGRAVVLVFALLGKLIVCIYHPKLNTLHTTDGLTDTKCISTHLAVLQIRYVCNCICIVYWAYSHIPSIPCRQMI